MDSMRAKIDQRFGATIDSEHLIYIYFEEEKKKRDKEHQFGLVMFDKYAGKEAGRLWLGERDPEFTLDPVTQTVFFKSSDKVIQALRFPADPEQQ